MGCNGMPFFSSNFLTQTDQEDDHQQPPTVFNPLFPPCSPQEFHGIESLLGKRTVSFSRTDHVCKDVITNGGDEDLSDDGLYHGDGEKKRGLSLEQLKTLENTFEQGNKLEPERKVKLARALGLQPRQIAIWFQNRRARSKTKQLEKDYGILKRHFDALKAENDSLISLNQNLHAQLLSLRSYKDHPESINLNKETITDQNSSSTRSDDNSSEIQIDISRTTAMDSSPVHHAHVPISIPLFPTRSSTHHTAATQKLFLSPSLRHEHPHHELMMSTGGIRNTDQHNTNCNNLNEHVKEESFSNMFCEIEDRSGSLWPWLEEQEHFD